MVFAGNYLVEFPKTPLDTFVYILAQWIIPWHMVTRKSKIVSMQNLGAKKPYPQCTTRAKMDDNLLINIINWNIVIHLLKLTHKSHLPPSPPPKKKKLGTIL